MKIAYDWLIRYIEPLADTPLPGPDETATLLTHCGLEVESVETFESVKGGLKGLVVGIVVEKQPHPDADKLSLTRVDTGDGEPLRIVCGAPNVEAGQKVLVARPGAVLHGFGGDTLTIKKSKIRGQVSEGMLCAEDEVGLGPGHDGILVLDAAAVPGMPAADYFGITTDRVFEIGLTPNRADAASHIGVARDLVAVLNHRNGRRAFRLNIPDTEALSPDDDTLPVDVTVQDPSDCFRYAGITLAGVRSGKSPAWLKNRLRSIGLTPINAVVDITNFVLFETGQPLHAFDADRIDGRRIVVQRLPAGTPFVTLDGVNRTLTGDELMICDAGKGLCMAGIFGGAGSGIAEETQNVFLESAWFNPVTIRRAARHHGLHTDASFRFERGVDPGMTVPALRRAAAMMREICGARIASSVTDRYPAPRPPARLHFRYARASTLAGFPVEAGPATAIFRDLGIVVENGDDRTADLVMPGYKADVQTEADATEELLRIGGYDQIPVPSSMRMPMPPPWPQVPVADRCSRLLVARGFAEVLTNSLSLAGGETDDQERTVRLLNPSSSDLNALRTSLLPSFLEAAAYNSNRKRPDLRLFQAARTYSRSGAGVAEHERLGVFACGRRRAPSWIGPTPDDYDIFFLKALVRDLLLACGIDADRIRFEPAEAGDLAPHLNVFVDDREAGLLGMVPAARLRDCDLAGPAGYADLSCRVLSDAAQAAERRIGEAPRFPDVRRDLSMILPAGVSYGDIERTAFETERTLLREVSLFDVYTGDKLEPGTVSYAVHFVLRDDTRTMQEKDINRVMQRLTQALESTLGVRIRS